MAALRSWLGALLSLAVFLVCRHFARGFALPTCIATIVACIYIWTIVLHVPAALKGMEALVAEEKEEEASSVPAAKEPAEPHSAPPEMAYSQPLASEDDGEEASEGEREETPQEPKEEAAPELAAEDPAQESQAPKEETAPEEPKEQAKEKAGGLWDESDSEDQDGVVEEEDFVDPERAKELKVAGNEHFKAGRLHEAREAYSEAIHITPQTADKDKAVLFANRAACHQKFGSWEEVVADCTKAVQFDAEYTKAYMRRSLAYEEQEKWHDACEDLKKAIELDPSIKSREYRRQAVLEKRAAERFEKDKDEMIGKLKDLGNMVLGKFGMSCDNFKMEQDPDTGSYSVKYQN